MGAVARLVIRRDSARYRWSFDAILVSRLQVDRLYRPSNGPNHIRRRGAFETGRHISNARRRDLECGWDDPAQYRVSLLSPGTWFRRCSSGGTDRVEGLASLVRTGWPAILVFRTGRSVSGRPRFLQALPPDFRSKAAAVRCA